MIVMYYLSGYTVESVTFERVTEHFGFRRTASGRVIREALRGNWRKYYPNREQAIENQRDILLNQIAGREKSLLVAQELLTKFEQRYPKKQESVEGAA